MLRNMPVTLRYGVPALIAAALAVFAVRALLPAVLAVEAVGFSGVTLDQTGLVAELYPYDASGGGEYPPASLGRVEFDANGHVAVPLARLDGRPGQIVARAPAHGIAWAHLDPERGRASLEFGTPMKMTGRILRAGDTGIAGAHVHVLSDRYGVLLAEATCDARGGFEVDGLSSSNTFYALRAWAEGFAVRTEDVQVVADHDVVLQLHTTRPVTGRLVLPDAIAATGLLLRAFRVPGLHAKPLDDGVFYLDHLPAPPTRARILVAGLPPGYTHRSTLVTAGDQAVTLRVTRSARVRGVVVRADNDAPVVSAYVEHPHGPRGDAGAYTDSKGAFELDLVPPGLVRIEAFAQRPRPRSPQAAPVEESTQVAGWAEVEVVEGVDLADVVVRVY